MLPLVGVVVGERRVAVDVQAGLGHARRIGERQVARGGQRLGDADLELARPALGVQRQRLFRRDAGACADRWLPSAMAVFPLRRLRSSWHPCVHTGRGRGQAGRFARCRRAWLCSQDDTPPPPPGAEGATPAMAQWFAVKAEHPDALLFFRMGDFYEMFFADAEAAAAALDIALTQRGEHGGAPIRMCGVPVHAAEMLPGAADPPRLPRRHLRADGGPEGARRQGADPARGGAAGHARHDHRGGAAGGRAAQPAAGAGGGGRPARRGLARRLDRRCSRRRGLAGAELPGPAGAAASRRRSWRPAPIPLGDWERRARAGGAGAGAAGRAAAAWRRRSARPAWTHSAVLRRRGDGGDDWRSTTSRTTQAGEDARACRARCRWARPGGWRWMRRRGRSLEILRAQRRRDRAHAAGRGRSARVTARRRAAAGRVAGGPADRPAAIAARQDGWSWLLRRAGRAGALRAALRGAPDMARALGRLSLGRGAPRDLAALRDGLAARRGVSRGAGRPAADGAGAMRAQALDPAPALRDLLAAALADPRPRRLDDGAIARRLRRRTRCRARGCATTAARRDRRRCRLDYAPALRRRAA